MLIVFQVNVEFGLDAKIAEAISQAADQVIDGSLYEDHFPLGKEILGVKLLYAKAKAIDIRLCTVCVDIQKIWKGVGKLKACVSDTSSI